MFLIYFGYLSICGLINADHYNPIFIDQLIKEKNHVSIIKFELKDENDFAIFENSIIYDHRSDFLFFATMKSIHKLDTQLRLLERLVVEPSERPSLRCYRNMYMKKYPCHTASYWFNLMYSQNAVQSSITNGNILFICHSNSSVTLHQTGNMSKQYPTYQTQCYENSQLTLIDRTFNLFAVTIARPKIMRFSPKYPSPPFHNTKHPFIYTPTNSIWMQQNDYLEFVALFEYRTHVYLVMKEMAEEHKINCRDNIIKSRIIRVLKADLGGTEFQLKDHWTSFVKANLICPDSDQSQQSFFTSVESAHFDSNTQFLYTTFNGGLSAPKASAVCIYSIIDISQSLDGPFYDPNNLNSPIPLKTTTCTSDNKPCQLNVAINYQLKFMPILPVTKSNVLQVSGEILGHIQLVSVERSAEQYDVVFISDSIECNVHKYYLSRDKSKLCYLETLKLNCEENHTIIDMKLINSNKLLQPFLVVAQPNQLYKLAIHNCEQYKSIEKCTDIFCYWNNNQCLSIYNTTVAHLRQLPQITQCTTKIDYSAEKMEYWSPWQNCQGNVGHCECRYRQCKPGQCPNHDLTNNNQEIQIRNCSGHVAWSNWNVWDECSTKCGVGKQSRQRWCFQGVANSPLCPGNAIETRTCQSNESCNDASISLDSMHPSPWSPCNVECGIGESFRFIKQCPSPQDIIDPRCSLIEVKPCQQNPCQEKSVMSDPVLIQSSGGNPTDNYYLKGVCSVETSVTSEYATTANIKVDVERAVDNLENYEKAMSCWSDWTDVCKENNNQVQETCVNTPSSSQSTRKSTRTRKCQLENIEESFVMEFFCSRRTYESKELSCDNNDLCGDIKLSRAGFASNTREFELVYIILVGVAAFVLSTALTIVAFCLWLSKRNPLLSRKPPADLISPAEATLVNPNGTLMTLSRIDRPGYISRSNSQMVYHAQESSPFRSPSIDADINSSYPFEQTSTFRSNAPRRAQSNMHFFPQNTQTTAAV